MIQSERFLELMRDINVTKAELARRLGTSRANVSQILRTKKPIDMPVLEKMAKVLGYEVDISFRKCDEAEPVK